MQYVVEMSRDYMEVRMTSFGIFAGHPKVVSFDVPSHIERGVGADMLHRLETGDQSVAQATFAAWRQLQRAAYPWPVNGYSYDDCVVVREYDDANAKAFA